VPGAAPATADEPAEASDPPAGAPEEPCPGIDRDSFVPPHSTSPAIRSPAQLTPSANRRRPIFRIWLGIIDSIAEQAR
jgi:hypothetical protein